MYDDYGYEDYAFCDYDYEDGYDEECFYAFGGFPKHGTDMRQDMISLDDTDIIYPFDEEVF